MEQQQEKARRKAKGKKEKRLRKDRYESQNYLLRIEGTLCCASIGEYSHISNVLFIHAYVPSHSEVSQFGALMSYLEAHFLLFRNLASIDIVWR
ncbi:unnamed protein product [Angiostrongylus costaricensis]|uniref:Ovule protein n=1 Tax=Angiostrongylus costaricensis TaxID=334426 RepID=A0A0R3PPI9_ANGCS|nr:unnamed protein product [Angiostrongylus costaricensis]